VVEVRVECGLGPWKRTNSDGGEMEHASAQEVVERLQQQVLDEYKLTARSLDDVSRRPLVLA
jgi:hypothetical protein